MDMIETADGIPTIAPPDNLLPKKSFEPDLLPGPKTLIPLPEMKGGGGLGKGQRDYPSNLRQDTGAPRHQEPRSNGIWATFERAADGTMQLLTNAKAKKGQAAVDAENAKLTAAQRARDEAKK